MSGKLPIVDVIDLLTGKAFSVKGPHGETIVLPVEPDELIRDALEAYWHLRLGFVTAYSQYLELVPPYDFTWLLEELGE